MGHTSSTQQICKIPPAARVRPSTESTTKVAVSSCCVVPRNAKFLASQMHSTRGSSRARACTLSSGKFCSYAMRTISHDQGVLNISRTLNNALRSSQVRRNNYLHIVALYDERHLQDIVQDLMRGVMGLPSNQYVAYIIELPVTRVHTIRLPRATSMQVRSPYSAGLSKSTLR